MLQNLKKYTCNVMVADVWFKLPLNRLPKQESRERSTNISSSASDFSTLWAPSRIPNELLHHSPSISAYMHLHYSLATTMGRWSHPLIEEIRTPRGVNKWPDLTQLALNWHQDLRIGPITQPLYYLSSLWPLIWMKDFEHISW